MVRMRFLFAILPFLVLFPFSGVDAQCGLIANACDPHLKNFISDGQTYRALLRGDQTAEFRTTLFEGTTYRIAACSDTSASGNLIFTVRDKERNKLFSNADHGVAPYWNFEVPHTMDVIIDAKLAPSSGRASGCAVLLVGFKE
ncbi:MAG: hypothetical protein ABEH38_10190 [Flavobacteriales bacterium]